MPAQNIIVYAKWAAPVHTVTFKVDGQPDQKLENIAHKDTITLPENPHPPRARSSSAGSIKTASRSTLKPRSPATSRYTPSSAARPAMA